MRVRGSAMNYLANFLTCLSLTSGFISIIFSLESHFTLACWAIIVSVIFDALDGRLARMNPVPSQFGKELDSLVDLVSFGVAPAILGYVFVYRDFHLWAVLALLMYLVCSAWRLARYNVTKLGKYFYGLPINASGAVVASFILIYRKYIKLPPPAIFLLLVLSLALLMVSKIKYLHFDGLIQLLEGKKLIFLIGLALLGLIFMPQVTIFTVFAGYLILAPFLAKSVKID